MLTELQIERWKEFALRMARIAYAANRRPTAEWIKDVVEDWFDGWELGDLRLVINWDNCEPYPEGHRFHGKEWFGRIDAHPPLPCDDVSEFLAEHECGYAPRCRACREYEYEGECYCEEIEDHYYEQWDEQWGGPVHCCIRAGLGAAVDGGSGAGVWGFTAGDLRKMYPEGVPEWVFNPNERLIAQSFGRTNIDGVLHIGESHVNGRFAELADEAQLIL